MSCIPDSHHHLTASTLPASTSSTDCPAGTATTFAIATRTITLITTNQTITVCGDGTGSPDNAVFSDVEVVASLSGTASDSKILSVVDESGACTPSQGPDSTDGAGTYKFSCTVSAWGENTVSFKATTDQTGSDPACTATQPATLTVQHEQVTLTTTNQTITVCGDGTGSPANALFSTEEVVASLTSNDPASKIQSVEGTSQTGTCTLSQGPASTDGAGTYKFSCTATAWGDNAFSFKATLVETGSDPACTATSQPRSLSHPHVCPSRPRLTALVATKKDGSRPLMWPLLSRQPQAHWQPALRCKPVTHAASPLRSLMMAQPTHSPAMECSPGSRPWASVLLLQQVRVVQQGTDVADYASLMPGKNFALRTLLTVYHTTTQPSIQAAKLPAPPL